MSIDEITDINTIDDSISKETTSNTSFLHKDNFSDLIKTVVFLTASYLTDPLANAHLCFRKTYVVDNLNPLSSKIANLARKLFLLVQVVGYTLLAIIGTLPGIIIRAIVSSLEKERFIHLSTQGKGKILPENRRFSLGSWNATTGLASGHTITDAGVEHWSTRIDEIVEKIIEYGANVQTLYEAMDIKSAVYLCKKLKEHGFVDFYFNIGSRAFGTSSGMFIASKYKIKNPEFVMFPKDTFSNRAKYSEKGVFSFELQSKGKTFAKVFSTHPQHSEEPAYAPKEDVDAREKQMKIVVDKIKQEKKDKCIILTGDLNIDDYELENSSWWKEGIFEKGVKFSESEKTWGGDEFCSSLLDTNKKISGPLNLDHTMIVKNTAKLIETILIHTGYNPKVYTKEALSDHAGLFSLITV